MNIYIKLLIGWIVWTVGAIMYTWAAHWVPGTDSGIGMTGPEFIYGLMAGAYFFGVPVLVGIWIYDD